MRLGTYPSVAALCSLRSCCPCLSNFPFRVCVSLPSIDYARRITTSYTDRIIDRAAAHDIAIDTTGDLFAVALLDAAVWAIILSIVLAAWRFVIYILKRLIRSWRSTPPLLR